jgi:hypothetical protein
MCNQRVLFLGIGFYDYDRAIIKEFEKLNYKVDYFSEVPPNSLKFRFYSRFNKNKVDSITRTYTNRVVNKADNEYDVVFIVKCENLSIRDINKLKAKSPKAKFILYLWDSIKRILAIKEKIPLFDEVYSFDRLDCVSNMDLKFNPLFFRDEYDLMVVDNRELLYEVYHLGWCHTDRLQLIKKLSEFLEENSLRSRMILFTGYFTYILQAIFGGELKGFKKYLIFETMSSKDNIDFIMKSKSVLDIAHPLQSGLTMRTIELLGMKKKIITTNPDIVNYDFYHPSNILIIDRENPVFNFDFFETNYFPIGDEVRLKYSISNWLKRMML